MGISYYNCDRCNYIFSDCEDDIVWCDCGSRFCCSDCADIQEIEVDESVEDENLTKRDDEDSYDVEENCCLCRKEVANDTILLETLLRRYDRTREEVLKMWQKETDDGE